MLPEVENLDRLLRTVPEKDLEAVLCAIDLIVERGWHRYRQYALQMDKPAPAAIVPATTGSAAAYWTVPEVAADLKCSHTWVYRHKRQLGGLKADGLLRFPIDAVRRYRARLERAAAA